MAQRKPSPKKQQHNKAPANLVAGLAVIGTVVLSVADLFSVNDIPNFIYMGMLGAALGAKFEDVQNWLTGGRR